MTRRLTFDRIATTKDTGDPVIRGELQDTGSWVIFNHDPDHDCIRIQIAHSEVSGDMSTILDEVVHQLGVTELRFMNPLDELKSEGHRLTDILDGFEERRESFTGPDGDEVTIDTLVGEWRL